VILTVLALLSMQQGVADRLAGRVPADVGAIAETLAARASARGLPVDPLIQKAIEGSAKGISSERVIAALRLVAMQLDTAAAALAGGTLGSDTSAIAAGEFAVTAGLSGRDVAQLARSKAARPDVIVGLRVAGTLAALGVPPAETVTLVTATLQSGRPAAELLALPARVQAEVARGTEPAQAAAGLARAAAAQIRHGPPPGREHPAHPAPPPHP
jgi:hypothetical protein